jgi:hypothetical protein
VSISFIGLVAINLVRFYRFGKMVVKVRAHCVNECAARAPNCMNTQALPAWVFLFVSPPLKSRPEPLHASATIHLSLLGTRSVVVYHY